MRVRSALAAAAAAIVFFAVPSHAFEKFMNEYAPFVFDDVSSSVGTIVHELDGIVMSNRVLDHSWTYFFGLEPHERHFTRWTAELEVISIEGEDWAGVTIDAEKFSAAFRLNSAGCAQLALLDQDSWSNVIDERDLRGEAARAARGTFFLRMTLDIPTSTLVCCVNDTEVFHRTLPSDGMPALGTAVGISMEATTPPHRADGSVKFGDLRAYGGRASDR